jgi:septal ring factor EnvC (AmiA/AmiB activator)
MGRFGKYVNEKYNVKNFRSGIDIRAKRGALIRAVCSGRVLFASWFKGYGNMIIIDHGDNYYTVYAHADELKKKLGEKVRGGEVIATVGDTGSMEGVMLHFEVRHHGKPIDPAIWLKNS